MDFPQAIVDKILKAHGSESLARQEEAKIAKIQAEVQPHADRARKARDQAEQDKQLAVAAVYDYVASVVAAQKPPEVPKPAPEPAPAPKPAPKPTEAPKPAPPADPQPAPAPVPVAPAVTPPAPPVQPTPAPVPIPPPSPAPQPAPAVQAPADALKDANGDLFWTDPGTGYRSVYTNGQAKIKGVALDLRDGVAYVTYPAGKPGEPPSYFAYQNHAWRRVTAVGDPAPFVAQPPAQPKPA